MQPVEHSREHGTAVLHRQVSARAGTVRRCGGVACPPGTCDHDGQLRPDQDPQHHDAATGTAPRIVHQALDTPGHPLDPTLLADLEERFGHDFAHVRIHTGELAARSTAAVHALAYTVGHDVVLGPGQTATTTGRRVLIHELAHVLQHTTGPTNPHDALLVGDPHDPAEHAADQAAERAERHTPAAPPPAPATAPGALQLRRQLGPDTGELNDADAAAEREYGNKPAPKAQNCGRPSHCPAGFCSPYRSQPLAEYYRAKNSGWIMAGISVAVNSRVVPLWRDYLNGGSSPRDLTAGFGADFTASPTTRRTTQFLHQALQTKLQSETPFVPRSRTTSVPISTLIPDALAALESPGDVRRMNFAVPRDVPGNLAGDIGSDQTSCPAGAQPSPFNDERRADGTVELVRGTGPEVTATPRITYAVKDTIDLCPGDCGAPLEQVATIPLSQFEATGISGDVPFTVVFPGPPLGSFPLLAPAGPDASPPPPAPPPTVAPPADPSAD